MLRESSNRARGGGGGSAATLAAGALKGLPKGLLQAGAAAAEAPETSGRGANIRTGTPAAEGGLRGVTTDAKGNVTGIGDILLGYQGGLIENHGQFAARLELQPPDDEVVFDVLREGKMIQVTLHLNPAGAKPKAKPASNSI